jgi:hypothetical protein
LSAVLPKRGFSIKEIVRQVTAQVEDATGGKQRPYARINFGETILNPKAVDEASWDALQPAPDASALKKFVAAYPASAHAKEAYALIEKMEWEGAREGSAESVRTYIAGFPNGKYIAEARQRLAQLEQGETARLAMATIARFKAAFESRNIDELKTIWPAIPKPDALKNSFKDMREILVEPEGAESLKISGDRITAKCKRTIRYFGVSQPLIVSADIVLRRKENLVVIESITYNR